MESFCLHKKTPLVPMQRGSIPNSRLMAPIGTGYDSQDGNGIVQAMGSNPTEKKKV